MSESLPIVYLARHGETAWSLSGQHTGSTDLPLTERGERNARALGERLAGMAFAQVLHESAAARGAHVRARGLRRRRAMDDPDLVEWNYGDYEGKRTAEILAERPGWELFRDGCPGGESAADVGARADRVIARVARRGGDVLVFSSAAHPARARRALARACRRGRALLRARHREPERARLRARRRPSR